VTPAATSVVIVTHNSAELVAPVLDALFADPVHPAEVIVVDSASSDRTLDVLTGYDVTVLPSRRTLGSPGDVTSEHDSRQAMPSSS